MALVEHHDGIGREGAQQRLALRRLTLHRLHLAIGREQHVEIAERAVSGDLGKQRIMCRGRSGLERFGTVLAQGNGFVRVGHQNARITPEHFIQADVHEVAIHIPVEKIFLGDEDRRPALHDRIADDASVHAAFADAGLIADDEARAALDIVDREPQSIDLLG